MQILAHTHSSVVTRSNTCAHCRPTLFDRLTLRKLLFDYPHTLPRSLIIIVSTR